MFITIITSVLRPLWATKAQFSTKPNWASKTMVFLSVYFSLTDAPSEWFSVDNNSGETFRYVSPLLLSHLCLFAVSFYAYGFSFRKLTLAYTFAARRLDCCFRSAAFWATKFRLSTRQNWAPASYDLCICLCLTDIWFLRLDSSSSFSSTCQVHMISCMTGPLAKNRTDDYTRNNERQCYQSFGCYLFLKD